MNLSRLWMRIWAGPPRGRPLVPDVDGYCYRNREQFNRFTKWHAAALSSAHGSTRLRSGWVVVFLLAIAFYVLPLILEALNLETLVPPTIRVVGLLAFFGMIGWVRCRTRAMHRQFIAQRMCVQCGYSLRNAATNEQGEGRCPECGNGFNRGWYRRPPYGYRRRIAARSNFT